MINSDPEATQSRYRTMYVDLVTNDWQGDESQEVRRLRETCPHVLPVVERLISGIVADAILANAKAAKDNGPGRGHGSDEGSGMGDSGAGGNGAGGGGGGAGSGGNGMHGGGTCPYCGRPRGAHGMSEGPGLGGPGGEEGPDLGGPGGEEGLGQGVTGGEIYKWGFWLLLILLIASWIWNVKYMREYIAARRARSQQTATVAA